MNSYLSSRKARREAIQNPSLMMLLIEEARDTENRAASGSTTASI